MTHDPLGGREQALSEASGIVQEESQQPTTTFQERVAFLDRKERSRTAGVHVPCLWPQPMMLPMSSCPVGGCVHLFPLFTCGLHTVRVHW